MPDITINGITVDPNTSASLSLSGATLRTHFADTTGTNYILIQSREPLSKGERTQLEATGAIIVEHVPENTYMAKYTPGDLSPVLSLPFVEWAGPYLHCFKIPSGLSPQPTNRLGLASATMPAERVLSDMPKDVNVVFHRDADPYAATLEVALAAGIDPHDLKPAGGKVHIRVALNRLNDLADLDAVRHIEEVFPAKLHNDKARQVLRIATPTPGQISFEGRGQVVAVCDTGFDKGVTDNTHPAFNHRVRKLYALGRTGKANDPDGHGTHVAGSVLADGVAVGLGQIRGTAPKAELILQSVIDNSGGLGGLPEDLRELFRAPYFNDQVRIHTNSWGSIVGDGRYDSNSFEVDDFVWNHRDMIICFAAGNEARDRNRDGFVEPMSVTPPGTAKNCLTVGACENDRPDVTETYARWWPDKFSASPIASDRMATNPGGMAAFSSRGPTRDRRFKPDVVAPGTFILSTKSRDAAGDAWGKSSDPLYYFMGGTSMATPLVAGCVALVREYLANRTSNPISSPSAALVKAMIINGAVDIPGQYQPSEAGPTPNFSEGFGRVDMTATIGPEADQLTLVQDEALQLDQGDEVTMTVIVPVGARSLKATLVWTDPPGETLQNDLDLTVKGNQDERHGNMAPGSTAFDRINNVEQVLWSDIPPGPVKVLVRAFRITQFTQSFALVVRVS